MQQQPIPPERPISVQLSAQQWENVLRLLHKVEAPLFITGPIVQEIQAQCLAGTTAIENHPDG